MKSFRIILLLILLLILFATTGCVTYGKLSCLELENQRKIFISGSEALISSQTHRVGFALLHDVIESGHRGQFVVVVTNLGDEEFLFSTENITAELCYDQIGSVCEDLKVYSYEDLLAEEKKRHQRLLVASALSGAAESMSAATAGQSHTYETYSGTAYSSSGQSIYGTGTFHSQTYDHGAAYEAQRAAQSRSSARSAMISARGAERESYLASSILRKQTVFPGYQHGGKVEFQLPAPSEMPSKILITVTLDDEQHLFGLIHEKK